MEREVRWYHATRHEFAVGEMVVPSSVSGEKRNFDASDPEYVYVTNCVNDAYTWANTFDMMTSEEELRSGSVGWGTVVEVKAVNLLNVETDPSGDNLDGLWFRSRDGFQVVEVDVDGLHDLENCACRRVTQKQAV